MSSQPSLISVSTDAKVQRPSSSSQWQLFRDTAAPLSGKYYAMNKDGVKEPITNGLVLPLQLYATLTIDRQTVVPDTESSFVLTVVASGGTAPYTYDWNNNFTDNASFITIEGTSYTVQAPTPIGATDTDTIEVYFQIPPNGNLQTMMMGLVNCTVTDSLGNKTNVSAFLSCFNINPTV